jgi:ABC-type branched-subunit amino acid transport system ATPase component
MATAEPLLEVSGLSVAYYGRVVGVHDVSLRVDDGEIVGVIGPNGAGKTSTLRAIAGFLRREPGAIVNGTVTFAGKRLNKLQSYEISSRGISFVPERDKVFAELTPEEHFRLCRRGSSREFASDVERVLELFPGLKDHVRRPAGYLSGGQRQMLAFATALLEKPRLLLVDEFSQGLAPIIVNAISESLRSIHQQGLTVLFVEQNANVALGLASRLYIFDGGIVVGDGAPGEISQGLAQSYLGHAAQPEPAT